MKSKREKNTKIWKGSANYISTHSIFFCLNLCLGNEMLELVAMVTWCFWYNRNEGKAKQDNKPQLFYRELG